MSLGHWLLPAAVTVQGLVVLGSLAVVGKAVVAYRQHASRPMLLLAIGLFLLLVAPPVFEFVGNAVVEGSPLTDPIMDPSVAIVGALLLIEALLRLTGLGALLASLYVRESPAD